MNILLLSFVLVIKLVVALPQFGPGFGGPGFGGPFGSGGPGFGPGFGPFNSGAFTCLSNRNIAITDVSFDQMFPPTTDKAKCTWYCLLSTGGLMNSDKTFNVNQFNSFTSFMPPFAGVSSDSVTSAVNNCKNSAKSSMSDCEAAGAIATCLTTELDKIGVPRPPFGFGPFPG